MSGAAGPDEPVPDSRIGSDLISRIPQARHFRTGHVEYGRACYYDIIIFLFRKPLHNLRLLRGECRLIAIIFHSGESFFDIAGIWRGRNVRICLCYEVI